jgi:hypothetical protein
MTRQKAMMLIVDAALACLTIFVLALLVSTLL